MKRSLLKTLIALPFLLFAFACQPTTNSGKKNKPQPRKSETKNPSKVDPNHFDDHWNKARITKKGAGNLQSREGRQARRLSVEQIKQSIPVLFNGITWLVMDYRTKKYVNMFDRMAQTLGQADYIQITKSIRTPTPLFMKFMDDMAGQVCGKAIAKDSKENQPKKRSIMRHKDINQNLRFLRLKFHSVYVAPTEIKSTQSLRKLYDSILATKKNTETAWFGVCVAVLTSPEFFAY